MSSKSKKKIKTRTGLNGNNHGSRDFFGDPLPGLNPAGLEGSLIVLEGTDGSGRSTQIALLREWLESEGFAVATVGLRRSNLVARDIDEILSTNAATRLTLALMYATDLFDQLENVIIPALRSGLVVLADRYIFTLIARAGVRGISREYLTGIYRPALKPDLTFWLKISPPTAFDREMRKSQVISYWESGRDLHLSNDLYESFIKYQTLIQGEFDSLSRQHGFIQLDSEKPIPEVNAALRVRIAGHLGITNTRYRPSNALIHHWR